MKKFCLILSISIINTFFLYNSIKCAETMVHVPPEKLLMLIRDFDVGEVKTFDEGIQKLIELSEMWLALIEKFAKKESPMDDASARANVIRNLHEKTDGIIKSLQNNQSRLKIGRGWVFGDKYELVVKMEIPTEIGSATLRAGRKERESINNLLTWMSRERENIQGVAGRMLAYILNLVEILKQQQKYLWKWGEPEETVTPPAPPLPEGEVMPPEPPTLTGEEVGGWPIHRARRRQTFQLPEEEVPGAPTPPAVTPPPLPPFPSVSPAPTPPPFPGAPALPAPPPFPGARVGVAAVKEKRTSEALKEYFDSDARNMDREKKALLDSAISRLIREAEERARIEAKNEFEETKDKFLDDKKRDFIVGFIYKLNSESGDNYITTKEFANPDNKDSILESMSKFVLDVAMQKEVAFLKQQYVTTPRGQKFSQMYPDEDTYVSSKLETAESTRRVKSKQSVDERLLKQALKALGVKVTVGVLRKAPVQEGREKVMEELAERLRALREGTG